MHRFNYLRRIISLGIALLFILGKLSAQNQTVGLFTSEFEAFSGYTLFSPLLNPNHYLIDNCGNVVHRWETELPPGNSLYLLEDGQLLKTAVSSTVNSTIRGAGGGEEVRILSWEGEVNWRFNPTTDSLRPHHDIEPLPNGNILMIAWEAISAADAVAAGRDLTLVPQGVIWSEMVLEVKPTGPETGEIVWQWRLWDHLIQDLSPQKLNFGPVENHPELMDINFVNQILFPIGEADWIHLNAIDYHSGLDQILLSSQRLSEVYVIDHSTTTDEARGHVGGIRGKGGDFLFRWGNPQSYRAGDNLDQQLFGQHDAKWIEPGLKGEGNILIFNNGNDQRPWTTVIEIAPPLEPNGTYQKTPNQAFGPTSLAWSYAAPTPIEFYSWFISGAQRLPNGNTLICDGSHGTFFEIDGDGGEVWRYVNPETIDGILTQGDTIPDLPFAPANLVFRAEKYPLNHPAFSGHSLAIQGPLELEPLPNSCVANVIFPVSAILYPNPAATTLNIDIQNVLGKYAALQVYNNLGQLVFKDETPGERNTIDVSGWKPGFYILRIGEHGWKKFVLNR